MEMGAHDIHKICTQNTNIMFECCILISRKYYDNVGFSNKRYTFCLGICCAATFIISLTSKSSNHTYHCVLNKKTWNYTNKIYIEIMYTTDIGKTDP